MYSATFPRTIDDDIAIDLQLPLETKLYRTCDQNERENMAYISQLAAEIRTQNERIDQ